VDLSFITSVLLLRVPETRHDLRSAREPLEAKPQRTTAALSLSQTVPLYLLLVSPSPPARSPRLFGASQTIYLSRKSFSFQRSGLHSSLYPHFYISALNIVQEDAKEQAYFHRVTGLTNEILVFCTTLYLSVCSSLALCLNRVLASVLTSQRSARRSKRVTSRCRLPASYTYLPTN
jgi:hypothetical protein